MRLAHAQHLVAHGGFYGALIEIAIALLVILLGGAIWWRERRRRRGRAPARMRD